MSKNFVFGPESIGSRSQGMRGLPEQRTDESNATRVIGWLLQGGVFLSACVIVFGLLLFPMRGETVSFQQLLNILPTLSQVGEGLRTLQPQAVITLGLLLLIATPVVRVLASIIMFALEHDRTYVIITALVLAILLVSIFLLGGVAGTQAPQTIHEL